MHGYHYHGQLIGEQLECVQEPGNIHDRYTAAVLKGGIVVSQILMKT